MAATLRLRRRSANFILGSAVLACIAPAARGATVEVIWSGVVNDVQFARNLPRELTQSSLSVGISPVIVRSIFDTSLVSDTDADPAHGLFPGGLTYFELNINGVVATSDSNALDFLEIYTDDGAGSSFAHLQGKTDDGDGFSFFGNDSIDVLGGVPMGTWPSDQLWSTSGTYTTTSFNSFSYNNGLGFIGASIDQIQIIVVPSVGGVGAVLPLGILAARRRRR